jgi:hypothetical protein
MTMSLLVSRGSASGQCVALGKEELPPVHDAAMMAATAPAAGQKKYGPGVSDAVIKTGNTMLYSGPASSYSNVGKAVSAYFDKTENRCTLFRIIR